MCVGVCAAGSNSCMDLGGFVFFFFLVGYVIVYSERCCLFLKFNSFA